MLNMVGTTNTPLRNNLQIQCPFKNRRAKLLRTHIPTIQNDSQEEDSDPEAGRRE